MSYKQKSFFKKAGIYIRILLFLIAILGITFSLPNQRKFRYEYQKGSPWKHENLIAPYSFTIFKLPNELNAEKDSIRKNAKPYFRRKEQVKLNQQNLFKLTFDTVWVSHFKEDKQSNLKILQECLKTFEYIYSKGIVEYIDEEQVPFSKSIVIIENNISEEFDLEEVFSLKSSYSYLVKEFRQIFTKDKHVEDLDIFIKKLHINEFIQPNLLFDKATTQKIVQSEINSISLTQGVIQKGEAIISKGEIIDLQAFRILESYRRHFETETGFSNFNIVFFGQLFIVSLSMLVLYLFLFLYRKDIPEKTSNIIFILLLTVGLVFAAGTIENFNKANIYIFPFTLLPILLKVFYDSRLAFLNFIVAILIIGFIVPNGFHFSFMQITTGFIAIISLASISKRGRFFITSLIVFISYSLIYICISFIQEGSVHYIEWRHLMYFAINSLLLLTIYPLIFIFEKTFNLLSDLTLIELSDLNQPLLRKLAEQAPGTFQHSLQVANLAVEAIYEIGGDALLTRAGALYHDIGKSIRPQYFVENQRHGKNPHDKLDYTVSAKYIINHINDGVNLAHKHKLHNSIISFIKTHHGDSKVEYFLRTLRKKNPDIVIDESKFTYPGPKPQTRENAVVMMADAVEAATRSLKEMTHEAIDARIDMIINHQMQRQMFFEADITFKEISIVKEVFKNKIKTIHHSRIEYPDDNTSSPENKN